jgi:hypothetical protein
VDGDLQALKLSCCELSAVPNALSAMQSLRSLDLSLNESLASLPPGSYLQQLEILDLSRCDFKSVGFMPPTRHSVVVKHLS